MAQVDSRRAAGVGALALALALAAPLRGEEGAGAVRVYGVELERAAQVDRLLVLASGEIQPQLEEASPEELILHLPHAVLDPRAARQLVSGASSVIRDVRVSPSSGPPPGVEIHLRRAAGLRTQLSQRGAIVALEVARPAERERGAAQPAANVVMNLRDRPLVDLVREVQRVTGRAFVWDDRLQGSATVIVQAPVTPGEALEILHTTLLAKGFAAVPGPDDSLLVLPLDEARSHAPKLARELSAERAALVTVLTHFSTAKAEQLVNLLAPFAGATLQVVPYAPTNAAILVGPENAIHRWLDLARSLDETSQRELVVIRPRHRSAAELHRLLSESLRDPLTGRAKAELFLDERSNALVVRAEPDVLASVRETLATLDQPPATEGGVLVVRTRFADPEKLAAQLEASMAERGRQTSTAQAAPPGLSLAVDKSTRSLLIRGDAAAQREVRDLIEALDLEPPLISIEARVLEVTTSGKLALGWDAFVPSTDPQNPGRTIFGVGIGDPFDLAPDPLDPTLVARYARAPLIPILSPSGETLLVPRDVAQLHAAEGDARLRTLMQPQLEALSGEEHEFSAGLNVPIPISSAASAQGGAGGGDPLQTSEKVERQDVGLRLRVKPTAGEAGGVRIAVDLEVTSLQPSAAGSRSDVGPELARRTLKAATTVEDGGVAILGMVIERQTQSFETGAPVLKDVPVIGNLLKQTFDQTAERTLVLTLQARILRGADERLADTIRLRTAQERSLARSGALTAGGGAWALRVATRTVRSDAETLAASLGEIAGRTPRVVAWQWAGAQRFDVVVSGFASAGEAAAALPALEALGWTAELVPIPERAPSN